MMKRLRCDFPDIQNATNDTDFNNLDTHSSRI